MKLFIFFGAFYFFSSLSCTATSVEEFFCTCQTGNMEKVEKILEKDPNLINEKNMEGDTIIHNAVFWKSSIFKALIEYENIDINAKNKEGNTALYIASRFGNDEIINLLLNHEKININATNYEGDTALHIAAEMNNLNAVHIIINATPCVNEINCKGETALHLAAYCGNEGIAKILTNHQNINVLIKNSEGKTALEIAQEKNHKEIVLLIQRKTPLTAAPEKNGDEIISTCRRRPMSDATNFLRCCMQGNLETVENFLEESLELINKRGLFENSGLHLACTFNREEVVRKLLSYQTIEINAQDHNGRTSLHKACMNGHTNIVDILLSHEKIDVNITDKDKCTPLHIATARGYEQIVTLLLTHKKTRNIIDVNLPNKEGQTPLHKACIMGNEGVIRALLAHPKIDLNSKDNDGITILDAAKIGSCPSTIIKFIDKRTLNNNLHLSPSARDFPIKNTQENSSVLPGDKKKATFTPMRLGSLLLALSAAACAWHESKLAPPSKEKENSFKKILSQKKKTIFLGLASLALFGGSFCTK